MTEAPGRKLRRADVFIPLFLVALGALLALAEYFGRFQGAWTFEFSEYADMARALAEGRGLSTHFAEPMDLALLEARGLGAPPWPMTHRFPLYPVLLSIAFRLFGPSDGVVVAVTSLSAGATAVLAYFGAKRFFPEHRHTGLCAGLLLVLNPILSVHFVLSGLTEFLFSALLFGEMWILAQAVAEGDSSARRYAIAGVLGGVAYLARYNSVTFVPVALGAIFLFRRAGWIRPALAFVAGFAAIALPWSFYRTITVGPVSTRDFICNLAQTTAAAPWLDRRTLTLAGVLGEHGGAILRRALRNLVVSARWFFTQYEMYWLVPLSLAGGRQVLGMGGEAEDGGRRILVLLYAAGALLQFVLFSFLRVETEGRYFVWIAPLMALLGAHAALSLLAPLGPRARMALVLPSLAFLVLWIRFQSEYNGAAMTAPFLDQHPPKVEIYPELERRIPEDATVISNLGAHLGWYARRSTIDLPNSLEDLAAIARDHHVRYLVLAFWWDDDFAYRPAWKALLASPSWMKELERTVAIQRTYEFERGLLLEIEAR